MTNITLQIDLKKKNHSFLFHFVFISTPRKEGKQTIKKQKVKCVYYFNVNKNKHYFVVTDVESWPILRCRLIWKKRSIHYFHVKRINLNALEISEGNILNIILYSIITLIKLVKINE